MSDTTTNDLSYLYWDELNFIPTEDKNENWFAQVLYFAKNNSVQLVDPKMMERARNLELAIINSDEYKKIIDPVMPDGSGGKADYFTADWKACPIYIHLNNIIDEDMLGAPRNAYVSAADEFTKPRKQKMNERIVGRNYLRAFINEMNQIFKMPQLKEGEDPFRYVDSIRGNKANGRGVPPPGFIDSLLNAIQDDATMGIFNEYIYKDGVETAFELGIDNYFAINKMDDKFEKIIRDQKNVSCHCLRYYTSASTGQPVFTYMDPSKVWTSPIETHTDFQPVVYWLYEADETYGDFVRMFGAQLKQECDKRGTNYEETLRNIFELNRKNNPTYGIPAWDRCSSIQRNNIRMRIGYMEVETQNMDVFSEKTIRGNKRFKKENFHYSPSKDSVKRYGARREESHYNVVYKGWYLPLNAGVGMSVSTTDFKEQSKYIFGFGKVQDQQREGDDNRYVKCSLLGYRTDKVSFSAIMNAFMPKINLLWLHFQNNLANIMPNGFVIAENVVTQMLDATDQDADSEDNANGGQQNNYEVIRRLKQTGYGIFQMLDDQGQLINNGQIFTEVKSGHLKTAVDCISAMMTLYQLMTQALGISETREGLDPHPRESLGAIQLSYQQANKTTAFIERPITRTYLDACWRLVYFMYDLVNENDRDRLAELATQIGEAQVMELMAIKDIPLHYLALKIQNLMTDQEKQRVMVTADRMAAAGLIDPETVLFIARVESLQYAEAILRLKAAEKEKKNQTQQAQQQQNIMEQLQAQQNIKLMELQAKGKNQVASDNTQGMWDLKVQMESDQAKAASQANLVDKRSANKNQQEQVKSDLEQQRALEKPIGS